jgi:hypothetical protein
MDFTSNLRNALMAMLWVCECNSDREIRLPEPYWNLARDAGWLTCSEVRVPGPDGEPVTQRRFMLTKLGKRELDAQERQAKLAGAAKALGVEGGS